MKVFLTTAYPTPWSYLPLFQRLARQDRFCVHRVVEQADQADIILFVDARHEHDDWQFNAIRQHPLTLQYRERTFLYNETDQPWCALPGLYVSMPRQAFNSRRQRACSYVQPLNTYVEAMPFVSACHATAPDLLFSFMGRQCHPVRQRLLQLTHPRAYIEDTSRFNFFGGTGLDAVEIEATKQHYVNIMARSKFVLCPRGTGTASYRLFETLAMGRVPVIVSDDWVPPNGPDWSQCALIVPEKQAGDLPALLEANEHRFATLAARARCEWETWFAPDALFHRMIEGCKDILDNRRISEAIQQRAPDRRYLRLRARVAKSRWLAARQKQA